MIIDPNDELGLEHILIQKFPKKKKKKNFLKRDNESGKIEKEFTLYKNNWLLNNKMKRDCLHNPLEMNE